jgi:hypothetical protein
MAAMAAVLKTEETETRLKQKTDEGKPAEGKADAAKGDIIKTNLAHDSDLNAKDPGTTLTAASAMAIFVARYGAGLDILSTLVISDYHTGSEARALTCVCVVCGRDSHTSKDALSCKLAVDYGITSKSVRDIWNMRTWGWATVGYWTDADKRRYLDSRLCPACRLRGVQTVETACEPCTVRCTVTKRRGRPPGIKETKPRKRASGVGFDDGKAQGCALISLGAQGFAANVPNAMFPGQMPANSQMFIMQQQQQQQMLAQLQGLQTLQTTTIENPPNMADTSPEQLQQQQQYMQQQQQYMQHLMQQQAVCVGITQPPATAAAVSEVVTGADASSPPREGSSASCPLTNPTHELTLNRSSASCPHSPSVQLCDTAKGIYI